MNQRSLDFAPDVPAKSISPLRELGAYEVLWSKPDATFKRLAACFRENVDALPSDLVDRTEALAMAERVVRYLRERGVAHFGVRIHGAHEYPLRLRDAAHPVELLYFQGAWNLIESPSVAVVGTRNPSEDGVQRAKQLVLRLVEDGWTIVSGLAAGIDTVAHTTAIAANGRTIAVLGTPISEVYPPQNAMLQAEIAKKFLAISQVPVERYARQIWLQNRAFFPERNVTMSALTRATIIVEASDTSGTLIQARAALRQGRKLFILDSCFRDPALTWPRKFLAKGAIRVGSYDQVHDALAAVD